MEKTIEEDLIRESDYERANNVIHIKSWREEPTSEKHANFCKLIFKLKMDKEEDILNCYLKF